MWLIRFRNVGGGTPLTGTLSDETTAVTLGNSAVAGTGAKAAADAPGTKTSAGPAHDGAAVGGITPLPEAPAIADLLALPLSRIREICEKPSGEPVPAAGAELLAPIDGRTEVWAAGVTYERSRAARVIESEESADVYDLVYTAERPELFFKSAAWRVRGPGTAVSVRSDSGVDVPEPELAAVLNSVGEVVGYTICNDMSSRSIEGQNPLYLPQAKIYLGGCAVGPWIRPAWEVPDPYDLTIQMAISRDGSVAWEGESSTSGLRRRVDELAEYLFREEEFPAGAVLSTGTSLVPDLPFTLQPGDEIRIRISEIGELVNPVVRGKAALTGESGG
ncbi:MAG TPA: fumarylacetoacetate hydrolase family protein [Streptosporangiaceae bacterium]|nr:fumarylacetoacetate hydrolase family protein [Streptosporangiaceae bacterium]